MQNNMTTKGNERLVKMMIDQMKEVLRCQQSLDGLDLTWEFISATTQMMCPQEAVTILPTMQRTQEGFSALERKLIENLVLENVKKVVLEIVSKAQVIVDIVIRNLYERTADVGFLATDGEIRAFIHGNATKESITERLKEYRDKYTVYHEIAILDTNGRLLAHLDETNAIISTKDSFIAETLANESYIETFGSIDLLGGKTGLVYSQKIEDPESNETIGILCLCFRFEDEMTGIFESLRSKDDKTIMLLTDSNGCVIASSDEDAVRIGKKLKHSDDDEYQILDFGGREYLVSSCKTRGYQGFTGLGWHGYVMIPTGSAFRETVSLIENIDPVILDSIMQYSDSFCPELSAIISGADEINLALRRVVWNGQVMAAGKVGDLARLKSILRQISKNGEKTSSIFELAIENLYETVISSSLSDAQFISRLMIDIMDRNLYERANDCRWWALTPDIRKMLSGDESISSNEIGNILEYINSLYTVYTRIIAFDSTGTIVAASNLHNDNISVIGKKYDPSLFQQVARLTDSQSYCVSSFSQTWLYGGHETYVYNAAVRSAETGEIVGGIGIVFDSGPEFKAMLQDNLPKRQGSFAVFTDASGKIISTTDENHPIGSKMNLDQKFFSLSNGEGISDIIVHRQKYYIVGATMSSGYREYKNSGDYKNDVIALVFIPIGDVKEKVAQKELATYKAGNIKGESVELATFIVGDRVYALPAGCVMEAVEATRLTPLPGSRPYLVGTIAFSNSETGTSSVIPVVDPKIMFYQQEKKKTEISKISQIIVVKIENGLVGVLVDDLDAVPEFDKSRLEPIPSLISRDSGYVSSIIKPENSGTIDDMLLILDPDMFIAEIQKK